jgi:LysR family transcriptional activator of nhaA
MDWLNYHHLYYFWVVAREGSVSAACDILGVSQSTVSTQLQELGKAMKAPLFAKSGRGLRLTETGRAVLPYAEEIFALGHELKDLVSGRPLGRPLRFRVGVVDVLPKILVHKLLKPSLQLPTPVRISCVEGKIERLEAELVSHNLDVVVSDSTWHSSVTMKVHTHLLGECGVSILAAKPLAEAYAAGFPASLDGAPFLLPVVGTVLRRSLDQWFDTHAIRPSVRGEFDDSALLKMFGASGEGLFAVPSAVEGDLRQHYEVGRVGTAAGLRERFYAISVERKIKHPAVAAICKYASENLGEPSER